MSVRNGCYAAFSIVVEGKEIASKAAEQAETVAAAANSIARAGRAISNGGAEPLKAIGQKPEGGESAGQGFKG